MKYNESGELYEFGDFRLDVGNRYLLKDGNRISLTPKEFEVLLLLVSNQGRLIGKDELLDTVWADTAVEEGTLTRNISWLRKKLGPDGSSIIETVPKAGYRFRSEVRRINTGAQFSPGEPVAELVKGESDKYRTQVSLKSRYIWLSAGILVIAVGLATAFVYFSDTRPSTGKTTVLTNVVPFSGLSGRESMPSFSPDGKQLAFSWDGNGNNNDIYVKLIGTGEPLRLTDNPANDVFPVFSPDGKSVAFVRSYQTKSDLYLIPALGGGERKICSLESIWSGVSFSPDGKTLAVIDADSANNRMSVFLVDVATGGKKRLTAPPDFVSDYAPAFSPDGKSIAFLRGINNQIMEIFVVPAMGGEPKQLTRDSAGISGLSWDRDGTALVFASKRNGGTLNLWKLVIGASEPEMLVTNGKNVNYPAISADGKTLAYVEELRDTNIWQIDPALKSPVESRLIESARDDHSPDFSPDGKKIAFASNRSGKYEIWLSDGDGKNQIQLTNSGKSAGSPRFSPDGKFIVFDSQEGNEFQISVISVDGGQARQIISAETRMVLPSWSADGRSVFFTSNKSGTNQLWKIAVTGGEAAQITREGAFESFASPDGKYIYYTKARGETGIWKINVDGSGEEPVKGLEDAGFWRYWDVSNDGIYFVPKTPNPPYKVRFFDFKTSQVKDVIQTNKTPIWVYSGFAVSSKDGKILFTQFDQNSSSIMLAKFE